jgi:hypothetical protein
LAPPWLFAQLASLPGHDPVLCGEQAEQVASLADNAGSLKDPTTFAE